MSNPHTFPVFFLSFLFSVAGLFLFLVFFSSSSFLPARCLPLFFLSFLSFFLSFRVSVFICLFLVCSCFIFFVFLLLSIPAFFFVLFVDVVLWCLKTVVYGNQVRFESLKNSAGTSTKSDQCYTITHVDSHLHTCTYICRITHNDTTTKTDAWRKTPEGRHRKKRRRKTSFQIYSPLTLLQGFERVVQGFACERVLETESKLHILTPLLWPSRCVFLVLLDAQPKVLGSTPSGLFRGPPRSSVAFPTTSRL